MSKIESMTWIQAYLDGYELECSPDKIKWADVTQEPVIGDGLYYRVKTNDSACTIYNYPEDFLPDFLINKK